MGRDTLTPEEVDAIDPAFIDSVTGDRLIATVRQTRASLDVLAPYLSLHVHAKVTLWLAGVQDGAEGLAAAAEAVSGDVPDWIDDEIASDPWAHDWRLFLASRDARTGKPTPPCGVCGAPVTIWTGRDDTYRGACNQRHWLALSGDLPDEQCRLCNETTICAHDLDGSPVCAVCWPGDRLLAERRAAWTARFQPAGDPR